eukprot:TRINITY_DN27817_c1_g1_i2.p1 TRINITY_DN27817_c1_g1~~TRINITY_DN27817_c1_g1_i2.p1  ORF type:complete len:224 (-),score=-0.97 TRINITY_DN27817_c1_g1_i2:49-720(-)
MYNIDTFETAQILSYFLNYKNILNRLKFSPSKNKRKQKQKNQSINQCYKATKKIRCFVVDQLRMNVYVGFRSIGQNIYLFISINQQQQKILQELLFSISYLSKTQIMLFNIQQYYQKIYLQLLFFKQQIIFVVYYQIIWYILKGKKFGMQLCQNIKLYEYCIISSFAIGLLWYNILGIKHQYDIDYIEKLANQLVATVLYYYYYRLIGLVRFEYQGFLFQQYL